MNSVDAMQTLRGMSIPGMVIRYRTIHLDGIKVFYREAGAEDSPVLLLLHGSPTASHMSRDLIPRLADRFGLIEPDLPGFGQSDMPSRDTFQYTFGNLARVQPASPLLR
jgi:pimeloyl-ACP methyl ester carboxylesterase